jgi:hypothetical protein
VALRAVTDDKICAIGQRCHQQNDLIQGHVRLRKTSGGGVTRRIGWLAPPAGVEHPLLSDCFRDVFQSHAPLTYPPLYPSV